jgi:hypothetical protein
MRERFLEMNEPVFAGHGKHIPFLVAGVHFTESLAGGSTTG